MSASAGAQNAPFSVVLGQIEASSTAERRAMASAFWARIDQTPLIESDTSAVLLWHGEATNVSATGDFVGWNVPLPLKRVEGTDLWWARISAEPDALLEYLFLIDDESHGFGAEVGGRPDPKNPNRVGSGFGPMSELVMPGYEYAHIFSAVRDGQLGPQDGLAHHTLPPGALPYPHEVLVYAPAGIDPGQTLPLIVFTDGRDYVEFAHAPAILDDLIDRGSIPPVVAAFVDPPNRHGDAEPNRTTEYGMNDAFVAFLADELVPTLADTYNLSADPGKRLIVGASYGGLLAAYAAWSRSDVFGLAYSQSGYHSFECDRLIKLIEAAPLPSIRLRVEVGTYETSVGAGWLPDAEIDFLVGNRRFRDMLSAKEVDFEYREVHEGHTWGNWRGHLGPALAWFFPR